MCIFVTIRDEHIWNGILKLILNVLGADDVSREGLANMDPTSSNLRTFDMTL